jgi:hypothetical protein
MAKAPWKRLKFDILKVKCKDPQDGVGRGYSDELHVATNWFWKGTDGSGNNGVSSSYFEDVKEGSSRAPKAADVTFVAAFKAAKRFPCHFGVTVALVDEDSGNVTNDLAELFEITESYLDEVMFFANDEEDGDEPEKSGWEIMLEAIVEWFKKGMRDDIIGIFSSEVTLADPSSLFPSGEKTTGKITKEFSGGGIVNKFEYVIEYSWTLS